MNQKCIDKKVLFFLKCVSQIRDIDRKVIYVWDCNLQTSLFQILNIANIANWTQNVRQGHI